MNFTTREQIAATLNRVQRLLCAYDIGPDAPRKPPSFCDCKFGGHNVGSKTETGCGCPEVRNAIAILGALTDPEWSRALKRIKRGEVALFKRAEAAHKKARRK